MEQRNLIKLEITIEEMNQRYNSTNIKKKQFKNKANKLNAKEQISFVENIIKKREVENAPNKEILKLQNKINILKLKINQINNENSHIIIPIKENNIQEKNQIIIPKQIQFTNYKKYLLNFGKNTFKVLFYTGPYIISGFAIYNSYQNQDKK